jgi:hypothetical protein
VKKSFILILFLLAACQPAARNPEPPPDPLKADWNDRSVFRDGLSPSARPILDKLPGASVYHLEFKIDRDLYHVTAKEEVRYTDQEAQALDEIWFHLFPNILGGEITISDLSVDDRTVAAQYELGDSLMRIPLSAPLQPNQSVIVRMSFTVRVPQDVERNYGILALADGVLALAHAYPMVAVYDEKGWEAEIPSPIGDVTYSDAAFYLVKVRAPKNLVIAATGREVRKEADGEEQVVTYADGPARDFFLAASADYAVLSDARDGIVVNSYSRKSDHDGAQKALDGAMQAIHDYSQLYAHYAYSELDIVATPTLALGIEYPGEIAITNRILVPNAAFRGVPASTYIEPTVAHEVGHQWFYNLVGNNQLDEPWLDESLAQFATLEYFQTEYGAAGAEGFRRSLEERWMRIDSADLPIGQPVSAFNSAEYSAIVYGRGPLFLEALQRRMGEGLFASFLKDYTTTHAWGIATTRDLKTLAEQECGCDLTALFDEWIY